VVQPEFYLVKKVSSGFRNLFFFACLFSSNDTIKMYENSSSPVTARQQQHEAEIIRRMSAARSSAFNVVAPYSLEAQQQSISKGKRHHLLLLLRKYP